MRYRAIAALSAELILLFVIIIGCSGGVKDFLSIPDSSTSISPQENAKTEEDNSVLLMWGLYKVQLDGATGAVSIEPFRGASFCLNVVAFLQPPAGSLSNINVTVTKWAGFLTQGTITLDVTLHHPFPGVSQYVGFDVRGVVMGDGSITGTHDTAINYPQLGTDLKLLNADGYTRWMNASEFTTSGLWGYTSGALGTTAYTPGAILSGYKYFADGLAKTDDVKTFFSNPANAANRGSFMPGAVNTREYQLKFPVSGGPVVNFNYAVLANWAPPTNKPPSLSDFPMNANSREAAHVDVSDSGSTLYYLSPTQFGGSLRLNIEVFDWQGNNKPIGVPSEINSIWLESAAPFIPGSPVDILLTAAVSSGTSLSSVFSIDISNCQPGAAGNVDILITVESSSPTTYALGGPGIYPTSALLAGYNIFTATVSPTIPNTQPTVTTPSGQSSVYSTDIRLYNVTAFDPDPGEQAALTYTWSVVPSSQPANYSLPGGPTPGDFTVDFGTALFITAQGNYDFSCQVKDTSGLPNDTGVSLSPLVVTVQNTQPTVGVPTGQISVWTNDIKLYQVVAVDPDPWDTLTYSWSVVPNGSPPSYTIPGDPTPGDLTIDFTTASYITGPGLYDISCEADDGSGWANAKGYSTSPLTIGVYDLPYSNASISDFLIFPSPHQGTFVVCPRFWHFLNKISDHDIAILDGAPIGLKMMVVADDAGVGPGGPPPLGGVHYYGFPLPLVGPPVAFDIELPIGPPFQTPPLQPTRFDGNAFGEMFLAHGSALGAAIGPFPEYAYAQAMLWVPGMAVPFAWLGNHTTFNGVRWEVVADVTDGFCPGAPGNMYTLFACDYNTFVVCGAPIVNGPCPGTCSIYQTISPHAAPGVLFPLPTSGGVPNPGPGIIDDSLHQWMSLAVDEIPTNPGLTQPIPTLVYILDTEGDIEINEVDFTTGMAAPYGAISKLFITQGNPNSIPIDCEIVYTSNIITGKPLPPHNMIVVLSYDQLAMTATFDAFIAMPGVDTAIPIRSGIAINCSMVHRMDVDQGNGDVYILHDSVLAPGTSAVSVFPY